MNYQQQGELMDKQKQDATKACVAIIINCIVCFLCGAISSGLTIVTIKILTGSGG